MSEYAALAISELEVSTLSRAIFAHLHLDTVGELVEVDEQTFLSAAYQVAKDDQRIAPALAEVKMILADMELDLARVTAPPVIERKVPSQGAALPDYKYLGSFECKGALIVGERRFIGRPVDTARMAAETIDLLEIPPKGEVGFLQLARLLVEPGLWDVYEREPWRGGLPLDVLVRHRSASALRGRHVGGLSMPDNLVALVDASHADDAIHDVRTHTRQVFDWGASLQLSRPVDDKGDPAPETASYFWRSYTDEEDPAIYALTIQAYAGELPR